MAKKRYISDSFWSDNWVEDLDPLEKYLFLYLLTNQQVSISGIYEIKLKRIAYETGIDKEMVEKMIKRFEKAEKVFYIDGLVIIVNFVKNQNIKTTSDNLWKGIEREIKELGKEKLDKIKKNKGVIRVLQGAYKDLPIPYLTLLNLTLPNSTLEESEKSDSTKEIIINNNNYNNNNNNKTLENLIKQSFTKEFMLDIKEKYGLGNEEFKEECENFLLYWKEKSLNGKKERWEKEKTFDPLLRFRTWMRNSKKWSNKIIVDNKQEEKQKKLQELEEMKKNLFNNF